MKSFIPQDKPTKKIGYEDLRGKRAHWARLIIPQIITLFTKRERYIPDIEWSEKSWTHNAFRAWEAVFGRAYGPNGVGDTIRVEVSVAVWEENGKILTSHQFHSFESVVAHAEGLIRGLVQKRIPFKIYIPQLASAGPGFPVMQSPYLFAIAYDNADGTTYGSQPRTVSIAVSGSNRGMAMHTSSISDPGSSMPTYNAVAATEVGRGTFPGAGRTGSVLSFLVAPATGTNTASFPSSGSGLLGQASSYTGTHQTTPADSHANTSGSGTTVTGTTTVVAANCWLVSGSSDAGGSGYANGTATLRKTSGNGAALWDSAGTVSTGSQSKTITMSSAAWEAVTMSVAPVASSSYNQAVTANLAVTATLVKQMSKTLSGTATVTATLVKQMAKTLTATAVAITATIRKQMAKALNANIVVTATLLATKVTLKALEATMAVTASIVKIPGKVLSSTAAVTATLAKTSTLARTLQATAAITASVTKGLSKALTASAAITSTLTKIPNKLLAVTTAITATLDKTQAKVLSATAAVTATMVAGRAVIMTATVATTATVGKTVGKLLAVTMSITAKVLAPFWRTKYPTHGDEDDYQIKYPHD